MALPARQYSIRLSPKLDAEHSRLLTLQWPDADLLKEWSHQIETFEALNMEMIEHNDDTLRWNFHLTNGKTVDLKSGQRMKSSPIPEDAKDTKYVEVFFDKAYGVDFCLFGIRMLDGSNTPVFEAGTFGKHRSMSFALEEGERIIGIAAREDTDFPALLIDPQFVIFKLV